MFISFTALSFVVRVMFDTLKTRNERLLDSQMALLLRKKTNRKLLKGYTARKEDIQCHQFTVEFKIQS